LVPAGLGLPAQAEQHLAERAALLHATFTDVIARLDGNAAAGFGEDGRLRLAALPAEADPPGLTQLRRLTNAMLPRVDLPEVLLCRCRASGCGLRRQRGKCAE
jgi:hypothetical protein